MILVAVAALTMWLVTPAIRILSDPTRRHARHLLTRPDGSYIYFTHEVGFWELYRRELWGLPSTALIASLGLCT